MNTNYQGNWFRGSPRGGRGGPPMRFGRGGNRGHWRGGPQHMNFAPRMPFRDGRGNDHGRGNRQRPQWKRQQRDTPGKRLSEDAIGVTEYISDHPGFNGVIKSRYSDFQVSEINENGEVAKLTTFSPPEPPVDETVDEDEDLLLNKYNVEILPMETWDRINKLAMANEVSEGVELDASEMTKEQRTKIHDAVKKAFGDSIIRSTVNVGDKKLLRFEKYRKGVRIDNRVKWIWPGEFVYFIVHKENCDTMDAAVRIAERLRINVKPSNLGYAGTKDRRAKTSQWFSLRKVDPRKIAQSCRGMHDVHVGNYSFGPVNLRLGMLKGNIFRIALRNVTEDEAAVEKACTNLRERGFVNYYGLQRFGTRVDAPTYEIGCHLLRGKYKEAIDLILLDRPGVNQRALQAYCTAGAAAAARLLPAHPPGAGHVEARLIRALARAPNDLLGALNKMARNTRLLYLHAYQSLVWNRVASERLRRFGLAPAEGDLVPLTSATAVLEEMVEGGFEDEENESESENDKKDKTDSEEASDTTGDDKTGLSGEETHPKVKIPVKVLTKEEAESGQYTIFDVILPLPGYNIEYPPNMKEYYEELMKKDELTLDLRHKIKSFAMSGAYRHMVVRPLDVSWRFARYDDPFADLIQSDLAELHGREVTGIKEDGEYKALLLSMTLPASCYATMALRELLKADTSGDSQALQNNYHRKKRKEDDEVKKEKDGEEKDDDIKNEVEDKDDGMQEEQEENSSGENGVEKRKMDAPGGGDAKKTKTE